jgi:hypothetical protein
LDRIGETPVEVEEAVLAPCCDGTLESAKQEGQWPAILGPSSSQVNESREKAVATTKELRRTWATKAKEAADVRNDGCDILARYWGVTGESFADE